jgi:tetratricopeptide (TPR) repeat protein
LQSDSAGGTSSRTYQSSIAGTSVSNSGTLGAVATKAKGLYELGRLHWELGDFVTSIDKLRSACVLFHEVGDHRLFIKCHSLMIRMYTEMEDQKSVIHVRAALDAYLEREHVELSSIAHYTFALCASYKNNYKLALDHLEKALALALADDAKEDICYAVHGLAVVYCALGRYEDALKEIYNLRVFFQVMKLPEVEVSAQIMNGYVFVNLKRYAEALDIFWKAMEQLQHQKNLYMYVSLLFAMGFTHAESGETDLARTYLTLAKQMVDPTNFAFLNRRITEQLRRVALADEPTFDIVFTPTSNSVIERKKGKIDFKNQFILLDMLKLFLRNPGEVYSKEDLVKVVWKQEYDPRVHDNKIYVTIKRLRQLIEPDFDKPKYIYRAKNGYYLNRNAKVSIQ